MPGPTYNIVSLNGVKVSGSLFVDTLTVNTALTTPVGYVIDSASYALTASYALNASAGSTKSINSVSINTAAGSNANTDYIYFVTGTTAITLPTAVGNTNYYTIKRVGTNTVTINTTSSQTIDGSQPITLNVQYQSVTLISDGANWNII